MSKKASARESATTLGLSAPLKALWLAGAPLAGVAIGYSLPRVAGWALGLPWVPMRGPLELVAELDQRWSAAIFLGGGFILGLAFAVFAVFSCLTVTVTNEEVRLKKEDTARHIPKADISAVFTDGRSLVILDRESRQIFRDHHESTDDELADAFRTHGYPWFAEDPYNDLYRRWIPSMPELPPGVNALLKAREEALRKKAADDVAELRSEIEKLEYTVRESGVKQYWRPLVSS